MPECSNKCGGRCCEGFVISATPERIDELYAESTSRVVAGEEQPGDWDTLMIAEMIIRLDGPGEPRYTCKHLVKESGLCGVYDKRPGMCRDYPYLTSCSHCGFRAVPAYEEEIFCRTESAAILRDTNTVQPIAGALTDG